MFSHLTYAEQNMKRFAEMNRQGMIDYLCATGYFTELPKEQQGKYLFGRAKNGRAICLIRRDDNDARVTMEIMKLAYDEIAKVGLKIPYLFFGTTCLVVCEPIFTFAQIPWRFD